MAVGTNAGQTWNTTAGNKTVVATPALNDLIVVIHGMSGQFGSDNSTITDNNSDGLGTYTKYGAGTGNPYATVGVSGIAIWFSVRDALVGSASSTTFTATNSGDTGGGLTVLRFSGMTLAGAAAVLQSVAESAQSETPPEVTFSSTTLTGNPVILATMVDDDTPNFTPPSGFTEATDTGWTTPAAGIEVCWDDSGNTATLFSWTGALGGTAHANIGIELDTGTASTFIPIVTMF